MSEYEEKRDWGYWVMYEAYFGLSRRPFLSVPQVDHYYPGTAIEAARQTLARSIERAEGVGMVVGPSGTGKTLLCLMLAEQFKNSFEVALLSSGRLGTRRALLQAILFELGQPYRGMDEGELRLALINHLTSDEDCRRGMVLLVDEAHTLPFRLLDEIRTITNVVCGEEPRTRLVLAGGSLLEERFASPKLESFSQRITARCYLESFNREETQGYIHAQIGMAGRGGNEVISDDACRAVYEATDGVPRLVNQVCDHALLLACAAGCEQVDRAVVEEAWADLQQLPTPWNGDSDDRESNGGIVEFGGLDDEPGELDETAGDEERSVPMLRISHESEEPAGDPVEQVERIEQALSGLDDDFRPAGSIGPELELVFHDPHDPFSEEFTEEEVVGGSHGRRRALRAGERAQRSTEHDSEEISHAELCEEQPSPSADEEAAAELPGAAGSCDEGPIAEEPPEPPDAETDEHDVAARWDAEPETVPMRHRQPAETAREDGVGEREAEEMIIVEAGYDDSDPVPTRRAAPVRRQEFGQLFARLRRGG